ncbi:MAG: Uma2 family endonuclease [Roseiflexaceae bacterium]
MTTLPQLMTAEELLQLPDDGCRYELVGGELRRMSPAGHHHGRLVLNLSTPLDQFVRANKLGAVYAAETGFLLSTQPDTVRAADVAFIRRERVEAVGDTDGYWPGAPDLAAEVVSPNDLYTEIEEKVIDWLNAGTRLVMIINPRKYTVTVYRSRSDIALLTENDTLDAGDVVPGWSIAVRELFV